MTYHPDNKRGINSLILSFGWALRGIAVIVKEQRNFRIHLASAILVVIAGFFAGLSAIEWSVIVLTIGFVLSMEAVNTMAEKLVDFVSPDYHPMAGTIKDIAAGGVLLAAIAAVITGIIIFIPKII